MTQYINFYQQEFRRKNDFHKWAIRGGIGIALALLLAINLLQQFNIRQLSNELTQKQDLLNSRKLVHQTLETQLKPKQQNPVTWRNWKPCARPTSHASGHSIFSATGKATT